MKLFEYAVFKDEKRNKDGDVVEKAEIILDRAMILAADEAQAQMLAARAIPDAHAEDLSRLTVALRPF